MLEEFIFNFSPEGDLEVVVGGAKQRAISSSQQGKAFGNPLTAAVAMIRTLLQLMHTLDPVPEERALVVKLAYKDDTPADYEPPFFMAHNADAQKFKFPTNPFALTVGKVPVSKYHSFTLKLKSVLDPVADVDGLMAEENAEARHTAAGASGGDDDGSAPVARHQKQPTSRHVTKQATTTTPTTKAQPAPTVPAALAPIPNGQERQERLVRRADADKAALWTQVEPSPVRNINREAVSDFAGNPLAGEECEGAHDLPESETEGDEAGAEALAEVERWVRKQQPGTALDPRQYVSSTPGGGLPLTTEKVEGCLELLANGGTNDVAVSHAGGVRTYWRTKSAAGRTMSQVAGLSPGDPAPKHRGMPLESTVAAVCQAGDLTTSFTVADGSQRERDPQPSGAVYSRKRRQEPEEPRQRPFEVEGSADTEGDDDRSPVKRRKQSIGMFAPEAAASQQTGGEEVRRVTRASARRSRDGGLDPDALRKLQLDDAQA